MNRYITKEFFTLPLRFQGLALPNPNIDALSSKIHMIREHWGQPGDGVGNMLAAAYLVFQNEVGIGGKVLLWLFEKYGALATHGFFRNLWQLLSRYGVSLRLPQDSLISVLRIDDRPLMEAVADTGIFSSMELVAINRFCHHKQVHSIGDMVCCDGLTIKPLMLTMTKGRSSMEFPCQRPTRAQLTLWKRAMGSITILGTHLRIPLGAFTADPHRPDEWFTNADGSHIYHIPSAGATAVYERLRTRRSTHYGSTYYLTDRIPGELTPTHRVSIHSWNGAALRYHTSAPRWIRRAVNVPHTLCDNLDAWGNPSLWKTLRINSNNCSWIFRGLMRGSLLIGHDGSYMPMVVNDVCLCAVVLHCTQEDKYADMTWVERSMKHSADNYRAEILSGCCTLLIVKAAIAGRGVLGLATPCFGCDNMGVVLHGTSYWCPLRKKQAQSDVLCYFKQLILESRIGCTMVHVHGHMDKHLR